MEPLKSIAERYWIAYYLVYVAMVGFGVWRYRPLHETGKDELYVLVAVFALAAGAALLAAILLEVTGRMVLLIPDAIRKIKADEQRRIIDTLAKAGVRIGDSEKELTPAEISKIVQGEPNDRA